MAIDPEDPYRAMFKALCIELGFCLHDKGEKRVIAARPRGADAMARAVFEADGVDFDAERSGLKKAVRECIEEHLATLP